MIYLLYTLSSTRAYLVIYVVILRAFASFTSTFFIAAFLRQLPTIYIL